MKYRKDLLLENIASGSSPEYLFFWGHQPSKNGTISKSCLSQWWLAAFQSDGNIYKTSEHYMMAQKAKLFDDLDLMKAILESETPKQAKVLGRKVRNFDQRTWDDNKDLIVLCGNKLKFSQNIALKNYLIDTESRILVEASPVDPIWGIGLAETHSNATNPLLWRGPNLLGFALMEVRDYLTQ